MSNYRRLISYIYAYEGGVKGKNIGFAKIETRGTQCKITVSVKKVYVGGNDIGVYFLAQDAEIYLGNIFIRSGSGEFRTVVSVSDVEHSGIDVEQCYGLTVHDVKNTWRSYTTIWEDAVAHAAEVDLAGAVLKSAEPGVLSLSEAMIKKAVKEIEEEFPLPPLESEEPSKPLEEPLEQVNAESTDSGPLDTNQIKIEQPRENCPEIDFSQYIQTETGGEQPEEVQEQDFMRQQRSVEGQALGEQWKEPEYVQTEGYTEGREQQTKEEDAGPPIPDRTICYRADAVLQEERDSANTGVFQASFGEKTSSQAAQKKASAEEDVKKNSAIMLTDLKELERLSKLEDEEEGFNDRVWDQLKKERTRILAFDYEKGCEILTIKPQDIGLLPREEWVYGNNSFLLHGYYNYRYLILARLHNPEGDPRYLLGVPGHYYSNERYMASMFGFPNFVLSKDQPVGDGRFGYWYTDIKLGD